ncbi:MAG: hypothetical protein IPQ13_15335 [Holophagaceae bacterium]|nr:hypothetical protein [Holophagaceae bacterium]
MEIIGSRRKLLFIEGEDQSLDKPLYSLLFPDVSVLAKSGCRDVEHAVSGIRGTAALHWLRAFGIVDNDRRTPNDAVRLKGKGVYAVSVYAVESIYYHPEIQNRVVKRHAAVTGEDASARLDAATASALSAIGPHVQRLSERTVEKTLREEMMRKLPRREDIAAANPITISIDVPNAVTAERKRLEDAIAAGNLEEIITRYPVRETPALTRIATDLGFQNREQYEAAVRKLLIDDEEALVFVRTLFGSLVADLAESECGSEIPPLNSPEAVPGIVP